MCRMNRSPYHCPFTPNSDRMGRTRQTLFRTHAAPCASATRQVSGVSVLGDVTNYENKTVG